MIAVLYEEDGYTKYKADGIGFDFREIQAKRAYNDVVSTTQARGEEVIGNQNYGSLPIVPMWGSKLHQSTLVGMKSAIDAYDLIKSGFANDVTDCAQVYWIISNAGGMTDSELARFRDRLKLNHIAVADTDESQITPYTQDIPYQARKTILDNLRSDIYEDFGALDVHTVEAGATNDHIDAAYQPVDEEADDLEYQVNTFIIQILKLMGIDDVPVFKRNRISNQKEQADMVLSAADYLDDETVLSKLPFVSIDEIANILAKKNSDDMSKFESGPDETGDEE
jgi:hypothetical protein